MIAGSLGFSLRIAEPAMPHGLVEGLDGPFRREATIPVSKAVAYSSDVSDSHHSARNRSSGDRARMLRAIDMIGRARLPGRCASCSSAIPRALSPPGSCFFSASRRTTAVSRAKQISRLERRHGSQHGGSAVGLPAFFRLGTTYALICPTSGRSRSTHDQ